MSAPPLNVLYNGCNEPPTEQHYLQAGHWSVTFDQGQLLNIRWRDLEVLRRIYAAVRDRDWGTTSLKLSNLEITSNLKGFEITFDARHRENEIDFAWKGRIEASANGRLTFSMNGEALSDFLRSRIGFCVLHSAEECAGKPFTVRLPDGSVMRGSFPESIAQEAPIAGTKAMAALTYAISSGLRVTLQFEGDIFQMEDQRAWTDATFKTFCTPLELPCPAPIGRGTRIEQIVRVMLVEDRASCFVSPSKAETVVSLGNESGGQIPDIGLGLASHEDALSARENQRLRELRISHLRADLKLYRPGWHSLLRRANLEARQLGCSLEVAAFVSDSAGHELKGLLRVLEEERPPVCRWLIFHCSEEPITERWILLARDLLQSWCGSVPVGSGTDAYFYQLMNFRTPREGLDFVSFAIQPQEHSTDNVSLVETLKIQGEVVNNARRLFDSLPVRVSSVTLKPRFNPNAVGPAAPSAPFELPSQVDARQMSLFGACWTLGSLKYLSESRAESVTYYETTGWRGVMEREVGSALPSQFPSTPGAVFPVYHVLADIGDFAGGKVLASRSSEPLRTESLALIKDGRRRVLLANMTGRILSTTVRDLPAELQLKVLDENTVWNAMVDPESYRNEKTPWRRTFDGNLKVDLRPYSIARIDASCGAGG
jgi:hypothetical protein